MTTVIQKPAPRHDGAPWVWWSAERKWIAVSPDVQLIRRMVADGQLDSDLVTCAGGPEGKNKRCRYFGTGIRYGGRVPICQATGQPTVGNEKLHRCLRYMREERT